MIDYPQECGNFAAELHHGSKMLSEGDGSNSAPNIKHHGKLFWVNELARDKSGSLFIPERFFEWQSVSGESELHALGWKVIETEARRTNM